MTAIEALQKISDFIDEKRSEVYKEMAFANEHNFHMESQALNYKASAYSNVNCEVLMLMHRLSQEEE